MKLVYIAGPIRAPYPYEVICNIRRAEKIAIKYWLKGYAVICPHKNTLHIEGAQYDNCRIDDETIIAGDLEMVRRCDVVVMVPGWQRSEGAKIEHLLAWRLGKKIIYEED